MRRLIQLASLALCVLGCVYTASAQNVVTGTIHDPQGNPYANGNASAFLAVVSGQTQPPSTNVTTNGAGFFTMTLASGSYSFTICAAPSQLPPVNPVANPTPRQVCFQSAPIAISSNPQDVSVTLNAIALSLGPQGSQSGGSQTLSSLNNIIFVDGVTYKQSPDIGASINTAYANLPANGGTIHVPAGSFNFSTPIVFGTANKPAVLEGDGGSFGTQLTYTGTLSSTAITENYGPGVVTNHPRGGGLRDIAIIGPGSTSTGIGLLLGGTNGAEGFKCDGCFISGFNQVLVYGNNTWATSFHNSIIRNGVTNLLSVPGTLTNSGEQLSFVDTTFINDGSPATFATPCAINNAFTGAYITLTDDSVDNGQICVSAGSHIGVSNIHMEYIQAQSVPYISVTSGVLYGSDFDIANDVAGTTAASIFSVSGAAAQLSISSVKITSSLYTFPAEVALTGGAQLDLFGNANPPGSQYTNVLSLSSFTGTYHYDVMGSGDRDFFGTAFSDADIQIKNETSPNGQSWVIDSLSDGSLSIFPKTTGKPFNVSGASLLHVPSLQLANLLISNTNPTIAAAGCGGTNSTISAPNGTASFEILVGSGGATAGGCTITMPAAVNSWTCDANTVSATSTTNYLVKQTGALSTTSVTIQNFSDTAVATAFGASDTIRVKCSAN